MNKRKKNLREDIGGYLRTARINKSLSGKELATLMNISQQQVSRYERGKNSLTIEKLDSLLDFLDKDWNDFFSSVILNYTSKNINYFDINSY